MLCTLIVLIMLALIIFFGAVSIAIIVAQRKDMTQLKYMEEMYGPGKAPD